MKSIQATFATTLPDLIYESQIGSNLGNDPTTDDGTNWIKTQEDISVEFDELARFDTSRIIITIVP